MVVREKNCYYAIALTDFFVFLSCAEKFYTKLNFVIGENQQEFWVYLYELNINNTKLTFGASEISNGIWGFALPKE